MSAQRTRRITWLAVAGACVAAVVLFGELSPEALLAVGATGVLVAWVGLAHRAGEAAVPVGRRGLPWLGLLAAAGAWEVVALVGADVPTVSDLADPFLAAPPARGAATVVWLMAGAWLLGRPRHPAGGAVPVSVRRHDRVTAGTAVAAAMRTTPGRVTVLAAWAWLGVHFLAR